MTSELLSVGNSDLLKVKEHKDQISSVSYFRTTSQGCLYQRVICGIQITIQSFHPIDQWSAEFRKIGVKYQPIETAFTSYSIEGLLQHIESELRTLVFSEFLGIISKKKIFTQILKDFTLTYGFSL